MFLWIKRFSIALCCLSATLLAPIVAIASDGYPKAIELLTNVKPKDGPGLKAAIKALKAIKKRNDRLRASGKINEIKYAIDLSKIQVKVALVSDAALAAMDNTLRTLEATDTEVYFLFAAPGAPKVDASNDGKVSAQALAEISAENAKAVTKAKLIGKNAITVVFGTYVDLIDGKTKLKSLPLQGVFGDNIAEEIQRKVEAAVRSVAASSSIDTYGLNLVKAVADALLGRPAAAPQPITYLTPARTPIRLPAGAKLIKPREEARSYSAAWGMGALVAFQVGSVNYYASPAIPEGQNPTVKLSFAGYKQGNGTWYTDNETYTKGKSTVRLVYYTDEDNCKGTFQDTQIEFTDDDIARHTSKVKTHQEILVNTKVSPFKDYDNLPTHAFSGGTVFDLQVCSPGAEQQAAALDTWLKNAGYAGVGFKLKENCSPNAKASNAGAANLTTEAPLQFELCWDAQTGKWQFNKLNRSTNPKVSGAFQPTDSKKLFDKVEALGRELAASQTTGNSAATEQRETVEGGEFYQAQMGLLERLGALAETGKTLLAEAEVPKGFWDKTNHAADYTRSPIHFPAILSGSTDASLQVIKDPIEMGVFAVEMVAKPGLAKQTWEGLKEMSPSKVVGLIGEQAEAKAKIYTAGGPPAYYEAGKDVVAIVEGVKNVVDAARTAVELAKNSRKIFNNTKEAIAEAGATAKRRATQVAGAAGKIWEDIVVRGRKGVVEALSAQYKNIDDYLAGAEYIQKVGADFARYQARGGLSDLADYTAKHRVITKNRMGGKIAEDVFKDFEGGIKPSRAIQTNDGARYIDNLLNGTAREIKSGKIMLNSTDFQKQVKRDIDIIKRQRSTDIQKIEWHALDGIDDSALEFIRKEMTNLDISPDLFKVVIY